MRNSSVIQTVAHYQIMENRHDRNHMYGEVRFYLADFIPSLEQSRYLMLKVLEQSVRDYCALIDSDIPNEQYLWEEAKEFIFDDSYRIMWGDWELSTEEFLDVLDIDIAWFREQTIKKFQKRHGDTYDRENRTVPSSTSSHRSN